MRAAAEAGVMTGEAITATALVTATVATRREWSVGLTFMDDLRQGARACFIARSTLTLSDRNVRQF
ncbi:hypothetical protein AWC18_17490 [Mycolicibacter nonchromogenicus]|uniref:Uncharacterized protein n=1 Tax=Mycolicibacter nonchromogenicus TaxID=1782 RepID=A0A1X1Z113_MYCNO|nr:hypothetical protein AWC18_17490 [Mycolicibacter nonchromogenicus]